MRLRPSNSVFRSYGGLRYSTVNPDRIISSLAKKGKQAEGLILDLSQPSVTEEMLGDVLGRVRGAGERNVTDIVIVGGN